MDGNKIIEKFYRSFAAGDAEKMISCYHDDITFQDPAFGVLRGNDARNMWRMLLKNSGVRITYVNVQSTASTGSADWVAVYTFSGTGRKVINKVSARFEFRDGKIIKHRDEFDLWKWAGQALGWKGYLFGWSTFMKNKIRHQATGLLRKFGNEKNKK